MKAETVVIRTISGPVTSTSIIMSTQAYSSNERIFLNYEVLFKNGARNDTEESFAATSHKFSEWLKVDRAYYSQARPWVSSRLLSAEAWCNLDRRVTVSF